MATTVLSPSDSWAQSLAYIHCYGHYQTLKEFHFYETPERKSYLYIYIHNGSMILEQSGTNYLMEQSNIAFLPYSSDLKLHSDKNLDFYLLYLSGSILPHFYSRYQSEVISPISKLLSFDPLMMLLSQLPSPDEIQLPKLEILQSRLLINLIADTLFVRDMQHIQSNIPDYLTALQRLFHENLQADYSLDELAHMLHVNKYKLIKEFKEYFLVPPMQYLLNLRIQKAKELLLSSNLKVSQIAEQTGFSNTNYFVHLFKKKIGLSPTDFRNQHLI